jgi:KDO2-lipid IV(A) lauroyltransferase
VPPLPPSPARPTWGQRARRWAGEFWLWYLFWNLRYFPWYARVTKGFFLGGAWRCAPSLRAPTLANAARILGPGSSPAQREALAKGVLNSFFAFVEDVGRSLRQSPEDLVACIDSVEGEERYRRARALRRGAVVVTAHLGSFEVGAAALSQREPRVLVVFHRDARALFESMRARMRAKLGIVEAAVERGLEMWLEVRQALAEDAVVIAQGDRVMPGQRGRRVPFMGGHVLLPAGPVKLAAASGAPLIPIFTLRTAPGRFRVVIEEPIDCDSGAAEGDGIEHALLALAAVLEKHVRACPEQWLMLQLVWCEDQPGAAEFKD